MDRGRWLASENDRWRTLERTLGADNDRSAGAGTGAGPARVSNMNVLLKTRLSVSRRRGVDGAGLGGVSGNVVIPSGDWRWGRARPPFSDICRFMRVLFGRAVDGGAVLIILVGVADDDP